MTRRSGHRRIGFSLVELLVVIAIIAVLMSLLMAAVMKARTIAPRAQTTAEIAAINNALNTVKSNQSFGQVKYIPPGRWDPTTGQWQPFRLRNTYPVNTTGNEPNLLSFEAQYIIQMFGVRPLPNPATNNVEIIDLGYPGLSGDLDANQTLTFFLTGIAEVSGQDVVFTGFSSNSQQPFTRRVQPDENRKGPILDLGGSPRKYSLGTAVANNQFPRIVDGWGRPFAYFAARDGQANAYASSTFPYTGGNTGNGGFNDSAEMRQLLPAGAPAWNPGTSWGAFRPYKFKGDFVQPTGFQLVSAGPDGVFGITVNSGVAQYNDWTVVSQDGQDDRASFSTVDIGFGPK